jgi:hypothetical protein
MFAVEAYMSNGARDVMQLQSTCQAVCDDGRPVVRGVPSTCRWIDRIGCYRVLEG